MLKQMVKEFTEKEIKPVAQEIDSQSKFPSEIINKMSDLGLLGIPWDEKYGGIGMDTLSLVIAIEEIGKVCTSTAVTMMAHTSLGTGPIAYFGTDGQKEKYLTKLAKGEILGAFGLTEPNAGSDAGNTQTTAELIEDYYLINGQKAFCTNAGESGVITITAKIVDNNSSNEKLALTHSVFGETAGAGTAPKRSEAVSKWANTSSQITSVSFIDTVSSDAFADGSMIKVWGSN